jgi:predicted HD phosphohydrolase
VHEASSNGLDLASLVDVLRRAGSTEEPNEEIVGLTILHHGLQCAALLAASDPDDIELQMAGLVHDIGHVLVPGADDAHGSLGAAAVRTVLGVRVATLVHGHVPAKRYLVTVDETYRNSLSEGSRRTLAVQGEAMSPAEVAAFTTGADADATVRLRRADEAAKDPTAAVPPLEHWLPSIERLGRRHARATG